MLGLIREIKTWQQLSFLSGLGTPSSAGGMVSGWAAFPWHQPREHPVLGTDVILLLLEGKAAVMWATDAKSLAPNIKPLAAGGSQRTVSPGWQADLCGPRPHFPQG